MIIPEDILQKQLCSRCNKYLSVGPIKVFPNKEINCGRCTEDNGLGVESFLYNTVLKDFMFPCIYRYDGCNAVLPISKMEHHEGSCYSGIYECFLCPRFRGNAYDLNLHCQTNHQKETLQTSEFLIDFNKSNINEIFFYSKGIRLFFVCCNYDTEQEKLTVDVIFYGKHYKGIVLYSLRVYSIEKELMSTTKPSLCSVMESKLGTTVVVNMKPIKFPRNLAICQFFIHEEPEFTYIENIPVVDSSSNRCILKCAFKNVQQCAFTELMTFPAVYHFMDINWRVHIKRKLSLTDYKRKFGVFLQWKDKPDNVESCKVSATFSVLSSDFRMKLSKSFVKREYKINYQSNGLMLADWYYIMDPRSGFVKDNCVNLEVKMKIYFDNKTPVKCNDCKEKCIYCN